MFKTLFGIEITIEAMECCLGLESTPEAYIAHLVLIMREAKRVLRHDGVMWVNLADSYAGSMKGRGSAGTRLTNNNKQNTNTGSLNGNVKITKATGLKPKDLIGISWMFAFTMQAEGMWLRDDVIWSKPNPMPGSQTDRCTKSHEYIFQLSKSKNYYFDGDAIREPLAESTLADKWLTDTEYEAPRLENNYPGNKSKGNGLLKRKTDKQRGHARLHAGFNERWDQMSREEQMSGGATKRDVWTVATSPYKEAHFAIFPPKLIEPCILSSCPVGGIVLDPFGGSGTTGEVAATHQRGYILIDFNQSYIDMQKKRINGVQINLWV